MVKTTEGGEDEITEAIRLDLLPFISGDLLCAAIKSLVGQPVVLHHLTVNTWRCGLR